MLRNNHSRKIALSQILLFFLFLIPSMEVDPSSSEAKVHIVYTTEIPEGQEPEQYHMETLVSVLGSKDAAEEALVYIYKQAARGFSAKLTPEQVSQLSEHSAVVEVVLSETLKLHSGTGNMQV